MRRTVKLKDKKNNSAPTSAEQTETTAQQQPSAEASASTIQLTVKEFDTLKTHIETLQKERDDTVLLAQRLQADFDNFRKRNASVYAESREEGIRSAIAELLPVLDGFDRAFQNATTDAFWADGIKLLHKQLLDQLQKLGLSEIPTDSVFDPQMHEAVMQVEAEGKSSGEIVEVYRKGYKVNDRIIRHSMVTVAK